MKKQGLFLAAFLCAGLFVSGRTASEKDPGSKYKGWLKLVNNIILPVEREVFLKLAVDADRDVFIETFWKRRDPTPGTPENEFKDEIIRRFARVNKFTKRGTPREERSVGFPALLSVPAASWPAFRYFELTLTSDHAAIYHP